MALWRFTPPPAPAYAGDSKATEPTGTRRRPSMSSTQGTSSSLGRRRQNGAPTIRPQPNFPATQTGSAVYNSDGQGKPG
jgi:hypothetical protein